MRQPTGKFLTTAAGPFMMPMMIVMIPVVIIYAMCLTVWVILRMVYLGSMEIRRQLKSRKQTRRLTRTYRRYTS